MKAILYCRVSSEEQSKGFSLDAQEQEGIEYAKRRNIEIVKTFRVAESAAHEGREIFNAAVSFLLERHIPVMLIYKHDRAVRNFGDMAMIDQLAQRHGREIHFYHENWEYTRNSAIADFYRFGFMSVVATGFSRNLSDITKVGLRKKAESGQYPGEAPFGYRNNRESRTIEPDPATAPWAIRIKDLAATGEVSLDGILETLAKEGCPHRLVRSKIERIAKSTFYHGLFEWAGQSWIGKYEPLVSPELHERAIRGLAGRAKGKHWKQGKLAIPYAGLLKCDYCGCSISGERHRGAHGSGNYIYYRCTWWHGKCQNLRMIPQRKMDEQFAEIFGRLQISPEGERLMIQAMEESSGKERASRETRLASLRSERQRVARWLEVSYEDKLDGKLEESSWIAKSRSWKDRLVKLDADIRTMESEPNDELDTLKTTLELVKSLKYQFKFLIDEEKAQVVRFALQNLRLRGETILFSYAKPFDIFVEEITFQNVGPKQDKFRTWKHAQVVLPSLGFHGKEA